MLSVNRYVTVWANDGSDEFNYIVCNASLGELQMSSKF